MRIQAITLFTTIESDTGKSIKELVQQISAQGLFETAERYGIDPILLGDAADMALRYQELT